MVYKNSKWDSESGAVENVIVSGAGNIEEGCRETLEILRGPSRILG